MPIKNVAVLGAGSGGYAAAVDLTQRGFSVNLFEHPRFAANIQEAKETGGIYAKGVVQEEFVKLNSITSDIEAALDGVEMVILTLPAYGVEAFAEHCIPHLKDGQMVVLNMAATAGSLRFGLKVEELAPDLRIKVGETASLTYGCRRTGPTEVNVLLRVQNLFFSAFPAEDTAELIEAYRALYPSVIQATNILETTLNNGNPITHPSSSILNAGRIEFAKGEYYLYPEGISPGVARVIDAVDHERLALCRTLGFREIPTIERLVKYGYAQPKESLYEEYHTSEVFNKAKGPVDLQDRYLTEDIPFGLVLWSSLGRNLGVPTKMMDAVIDIGSILCERDFRSEGLTAKKLGLEGLSASQINGYLMTGKK